MFISESKKSSGDRRSVAVQRLVDLQHQSKHLSRLLAAKREVNTPTILQAHLYQRLSPVHGRPGPIATRACNILIISRQRNKSLHVIMTTADVMIAMFLYFGDLIMVYDVFRIHYPRCYASAVLAMGLCPSVCLCLSVSVFVTSRCSTKTAKRRITQTTPHDTPGTLIF